MRLLLILALLARLAFAPPSTDPALAANAADPARPAPSQALLDQLFTAQEWQASGNLEAARRSLEEVVRQHPGEALARIRLAQVQARQGDLAGALAGLDEALADWPDNLLALLWRGHAILALSRQDGQAPESPTARGDSERLFQAMDAYRRVLALEPGNVWARLGLAACLLHKGRESEAAGHLASAQAAAGADALARLTLGDIFLRLNLPVNARLELERCLELDPRQPRALTLFGEACLRLGLEKLALDSWRQALAVDPAEGRARANLSRTLMRQAEQAQVQGRKEEAAALLRSLLGYDPASQEARDRLRALAAP